MNFARERDAWQRWLEAILWMDAIIYIILMLNKRYVANL